MLRDLDLARRGHLCHHQYNGVERAVHTPASEALAINTEPITIKCDSLPRPFVSSRFSPSGDARCSVTITRYESCFPFLPAGLPLPVPSAAVSLPVWVLFTLPLLFSFLFIFFSCFFLSFFFSIRFSFRFFLCRKVISPRLPFS